MSSVRLLPAMQNLLVVPISAFGGCVKVTNSKPNFHEASYLWLLVDLDGHGAGEISRARFGKKGYGASFSKRKHSACRVTWWFLEFFQQPAETQRMKHWGLWFDGSGLAIRFWDRPVKDAPTLLAQVITYPHPRKMEELGGFPFDLPLNQSRKGYQHITVRIFPKGWFQHHSG